MAGKSATGLRPLTNCALRPVTVAGGQVRQHGCAIDDQGFETADVSVEGMNGDCQRKDREQAMTSCGGCDGQEK